MTSVPILVPVHQRVTSIQHTVVIKDGALPITIINAVEHVISSAAWPLAAVIIAHLFKEELRNLLTRLRSLRGPGFEASLDGLIQNTLAPVLGAMPVQDEIPKTPETANLDATAPAEAIASAWLRVDSALDKALERAAATANGSTFKQRIQALEHEIEVPTRLSSLINELYTIHNRAANRLEPISRDSMRLYVANANKAVSDLDALTS